MGSDDDSVSGDPDVVELEPVRASRRLGRAQIVAIAVVVCVLGAAGGVAALVRPTSPPRPREVRTAGAGGGAGGADDGTSASAQVTPASTIAPDPGRRFVDGIVATTRALPPDSSTITTPHPTSTLSPGASTTTRGIAPGAPRLLELTGDGVAHHLTYRFDQPVTFDRSAQLGGVIVYGPDSACSTPQGNAHGLISGDGTTTITLDAYIQPGVNYVSGFAGKGTTNNKPAEQPVCRRVDGGAGGRARFVSGIGDAGSGSGGQRLLLRFDRAVVRPDPTQVTVFSDAGCATERGRGQSGTVTSYGDESVSFTSTGLAVGTQYVRLAEGAATTAAGEAPSEATACVAITVVDRPHVLSSTANGTRLSVTFDRPVTNIDSEMLIVVFTSDAGCRSPNGNSHAYVSGDGTSTIVVEATSLASGTSYIQVNEGFAAANGVANRGSGCVAAPRQ